MQLFVLFRQYHVIFRCHNAVLLNYSVLSIFMHNSLPEDILGEILEELIVNYKCLYAVLGVILAVPCDI